MLSLQIGSIIEYVEPSLEKIKNKTLHFKSFPAILLDGIVAKHSNRENIEAAMSRFSDDALTNIIEYVPQYEDLPIVTEIYRKTEVYPAEVLDKVKKSLGNIKVVTMTPKAYAEMAMLQDGHMRALYFRESKKWNFDTIQNLDISTEDLHSMHIVIYNEDGIILSSVRIVYPRIPNEFSKEELEGSYEAKVKLLKNLEFLASSEIDIDVENVSAMESVAKLEVSDRIVSALLAGKFNSVERLTVRDKASFENLYPELPYKYYLSVIIPLLMSEVTAVSLNTNTTLSLVQCDMSFFFLLLSMLGDGITELASTTQQLNTGEDDVCKTILIDLQKSFEYVNLNNPKLARHTEMRSYDLTPNIMINYNKEYDEF